MRTSYLHKFIILVVCLYASVTVAATQDAKNALKNITVKIGADKQITLDIKFSHPLKRKPAHFTTKKPARIVFDFPNVVNSLPSKQQHQIIKKGVLDAIGVVSAKDRMRIVLDLAHLSAYRSAVRGKHLTITLLNKVYKKIAEKPLYISHQHVAKLPNRILNIDFRGSVDRQQAGEVVIDLSNSTMNPDIQKKGNKIILSFSKTSIPSKMLHRLDVSDFNTPVKTIDIMQHTRDVLVEINVNNDSDYFAYQIDNLFKIEVFPLSEEQQKNIKLKRHIFSGKPISLNFQNIPIRSVLQLLADFTGLNMVVSDSVKGNITLRLNNIPWDQALDVILRTQNLAKRQMGTVLLIAPAKEINNQEQQELAAKKEVKGLLPLHAELIQLNYANATDISALLSADGNSLLSARGRASVDKRTNMIWVQDTSDKLTEIKKLVHQLDIPVKQVLIEARVVEVNRDFQRELGIQFGTTKPTHLSGSLTGANELIQGTAASAVAVADRLNFDFAAAAIDGITPSRIGLALAKLGNGVLLDLELSALESEGLGEVISNPRLITANQQTASIESGKEIPYEESTSSGATSVAFKKAVLSLEVTPQITPDNRIILTLKVNQDSVDSQLFNGVPAILTKEINTQVLLNNGQTIVLGGIYKQDKTHTVKRIPFLSDIPLIGKLFQNKSYKIEHEELLIFITPKIIQKDFS